LAIDAIVQDYEGKVGVPSCYMWNVSTAYREGISVSCDSNNAKLRPRNVDALRYGQHSSMKGVKSVGLEIVWEAAIASDP
jgi:hypothetical protein